MGGRSDQPLIVDFMHNFPPLGECGFLPARFFPSQNRMSKNRHLGIPSDRSIHPTGRYQQ
jgi:hypothetical protein